MGRSSLVGEHLRVSVGNFLAVDDFGADAPECGGLIQVLRARKGGDPIRFPPRTPHSAQLCWVVTGGIVAGQLGVDPVHLGAGTVLALGDKTESNVMTADYGGATVVVATLPEEGQHRQVPLGAALRLRPDFEQLRGLPLQWSGREGFRSAKLATTGSLMTLTLLSFGRAAAEVPTRHFPRGEFWVLLWGGAKIFGEQCGPGTFGVVGPHSTYAPTHIQEGTLVLVLTPSCPQQPPPVGQEPVLRRPPWTTGA